MTDKEIVDWLSEDSGSKLASLVINHNHGFCKGLPFRCLVQKVKEWIDDTKKEEVASEQPKRDSLRV